MVVCFEVHERIPTSWQELLIRRGIIRGLSALHTRFLKFEIPTTLNSIFFVYETPTVCLKSVQVIEYTHVSLKEIKSSC